LQLPQATQPHQQLYFNTKESDINMPIILTDKILADAQLYGLTINEAMEKAYESEIQDAISKNPKLKDLTPLQMAMRDAGLTKKSLVKDFYTSGGNELLFPAIIDTRLAETVAQNPILQYVIGSEQTVAGTAVKGITLDLTSAENKKALNKRDVAQGADLPVVKIQTGDKAISLYKRGVAVESTYEASMYTPLDMFLKTIDVIAANAAQQQMGDVIDVIVNGDGNNNAAPSQEVGTSGALTTDDIITFAMDFWDASGGLALDTLIVPKAQYLKVINLLVELNKANSYKLGNKFNFPQSIFSDMTVIYDTRVPQSGGKDQILGINRANAITKYIAAGSQINEIAKNIRNQTQLGTISEIVGFSKFINSASRVLKQK
jgi:hypothetical protein